ncbi:hypothetical protein [Halorientalis pallida]|uniref:DUF8125 domain-containing protein n=1 Tax=Halorientalis pallida TaxID=2479928 RepID=A0A498KQU8_9EURY|nr:hypothetical protein [Halorientalis pallida]RXK46599.1 hypothetical protein EAF64_18130 [Halorientalis pallida]
MNRREAAVELLTAYRWWIGSATVVAVGLAVWFGLPEIPEIPRGPRLFAVGALAAIALGYAPAMKIVEYLYSPEGTYLVDIDSRDNGFALYHLSPEKWKHLEVETGELYRLKTSADAYACRQYWPDYDVCMGTWRGSASDLELLEERERIDEIRETLEQQAQEGLTMRMKVGSIVRTAVRDIVNDLVSQYEGTAIHRGERVEDAVNEAMKDHNLRDDEEREREEQRQTEHQDGDKFGPDPKPGENPNPGQQPAATDGGEPT